MGAVIKNSRQKGHFMAALASFAILGATAACGSDQPAPAAAVSTTAVVASSSSSAPAVETSAAETSADETSAAETGADETSADETSADETSAPAPETSSAASSSVAAPASSAAAASTYKDGTYTATGNYSSPGGTEQVKVDVTLAADIVTAVTVTPQSGNPTGQQFESQFAGGISAEVVGKDIDSLAVTKVAGSSLTSGGFNEAIETIKTDAQA